MFERYIFPSLPFPCHTNMCVSTLGPLGHFSLHHCLFGGELEQHYKSRVETWFWVFSHFSFLFVVGKFVVGNISPFPPGPNGGGGGSHGAGAPDLSAGGPGPLGGGCGSSAAGLTQRRLAWPTTLQQGMQRASFQSGRTCHRQTNNLRELFASTHCVP